MWWSVIDTDYDKYFVDYQCYDGLHAQLTEGGEMVPAHMTLVYIGTSSPDTESAELDTLVDKIIARVPELTKEEFV